MAHSSDVQVLSAWRSPFGVRVLIALKEKGVQYQYMEEEDHILNKSQLLLESNPVHKKVPVLFHKGKPICESLIILQYIDETWPSHDADKGFLPQDPYKRALVRFWADFAGKKLYDSCVLILKNVEGELMEQGRIGMKECMLTLDGALQDVFGGGRYFGGDHINLVDIALSSYLCLFGPLEALANFTVIDPNKCPHLYAWANIVVQHESVKEGLATAPSAKYLKSIRHTRKTIWSLDND